MELFESSATQQFDVCCSCRSRMIEAGGLGGPIISSRMTLKFAALESGCGPSRGPYDDLGFTFPGVECGFALQRNFVIGREQDTHNSTRHRELQQNFPTRAGQHGTNRSLGQNSVEGFP
jgi:hypothetical protein